MSAESSDSETGDTLNKGVGGGALPTPITLTVSGLPVALWVMIRLTDFTPTEVGINLTVTNWFVPAATAALVGETLNRLAFVPTTVIDVTAKLAVPVLASITVFWDDEPTAVESMTSESGRETAGAVDGGGEAGTFPTPETTTCAGDPEAL